MILPTVMVRVERFLVDATINSLKIFPILTLIILDLINFKESKEYLNKKDS